VKAARLRAVRVHAQGLAGARAGTVVAAVTRAGALQAQSTPAVRLAVRARTNGLHAADVDAERAVARTWLMRGTLHMVPTADVRWMVALLGPVYVAADKRRRAQLGLDDATCARGLDALRAMLAEPLTRAEIVGKLAEHGVRLDPRSQAPPHLLAYAAGHGVLCRGPDAARDEPTYVALDRWTAGVPEHAPADPGAELARRYLGAYGPATAADFAAWSGLPAAVARTAFKAIDGELVEVDAAAVALTGTALDPPDAGPPRLLGGFDAYLLGHRDRDLVLDPRHRREVQAGGMIAPVVLVAGAVAGTWRMTRRRGTVTITVHPFGRAPRAGLRAEAADVGRFLGADATLEIA
jgi:Winged helix DNA-binding domain